MQTKIPQNRVIEMSADPHDVYGFIHLMSSSERRYFSARQTDRGVESQFFKFYRFILAEKIVDDNQLRQHRLGQPFTLSKNLSMEKKRLMNQLMLATVDYDASSTPSIQRKQLIAEAESLEARGYVTLARERLESLKEKAEKAGIWSMLLEVQFIEARLRLADSSPIAPSLISNWMQERKANIQHMHAETKLRWAWEMLLVLKRQPKVEDRRKLLDEVEIILQEFHAKPDLHIALQLWRQVSSSILALLQGDAVKAKLEYGAVIEILEHNSQMVQENPNAAMIHYYNYLNIAHSSRDYSSFLRLIPRVETLEKKLDRNGRNQSNYARMLWIIYYANNQAIEKAAILAKEQYTQNRLPIPGTPISSYLVSLYNSVILLFFCSQYDDALAIIDEVLSTQKYRVRTDLRDTLFLLETIILYEKGEETRLQAKLNSLRARTFTDPATRTYFRIIVKIVNEALKGQSVNSGPPINWDDFVSTLQSIQIEYPILQHSGITEITLWASAKAKNTTIPQCMDANKELRFPLSQPGNTEEEPLESADFGI